MSDKSHVSMEQHVCIVCGNPYDTGAVLLKKNLRPTLERNTITGMGMCPRDQEKLDEGYIALVEIDNSQIAENVGYLKQEAAPRTGRLCHIRVSVFEHLMQQKAPTDKSGKMIPMVFVDQEVIPKIEAMVQE